VIFRGSVTEDGKLELDEPARWLAVLASLRKRIVQVTLERASARRSLRQNRLYWWCIVPSVAEYLSIGRTLPLSDDDAHYVLKRAFLGAETTRLGSYPKSTRTLTTEEFSVYCEKIVAHCASEWGLQIPMPDDKEAA